MRAVEANGAGAVKLYLLNHDTAKSNGLSGEAFDAAAAEAKRQKLRALVHVESAADFRRAVRAGVAGIVHTPYAQPSTALPAANYLLTAADAAAARAAGVVVPTLNPPLATLDGEKLAAVRDVQRRNLLLLRDAGVPLALGADSQSSDMHDELTPLRGFTLFDGAAVLRMATAHGARLTWGDRRVSALEPGLRGVGPRLVPEPDRHLERPAPPGARRARRRGADRLGRPVARRLPGRAGAEMSRCPTAPRFA